MAKLKAADLFHLAWRNFNSGYTETALGQLNNAMEISFQQLLD